jgi:hypothetical protein
MEQGKKNPPVAQRKKRMRKKRNLRVKWNGSGWMNGKSSVVVVAVTKAAVVERERKQENNKK